MKSDRVKALHKLGLWVIFFGILLAFILISNLFTKDKNIEPNEVSEKVENDFSKSINGLKTEHYFLEAKINNNGIVYYFTGKKINDQLEGYWQEDNNIIKCQIIDNKCSSYDVFYLDIDNILNLLKEDLSKAIVTEKETEISYEFTNLNGIYLLLQIKNNYVKQIIINDNLINYEINLMYIKD